jgi:hypothetical protein
MKLKDKDNGDLVSRAELILEGKHDVALLRRALAVYDAHVTDETADYVILLPLSDN